MLNPDDLPPKNAPLRRWVIDLSLLNKTRLLFLLLLGMFLAVCGSYFLLQYREQDARVWTVHTYQVLTTAERADSQLRDGRRTLRDGLLSADVTRIDSYQASNDRLQATLHELRLLVHDNPVQLVRLARVSDLIDQWVGAFVVPSIALLQQPQELQRRLTDPQFLQFIGSGPSSLEPIQKLLTDFKQEEQGLLNERITRLDGAVRLGRQVMLTLMVIGISFGLYGLTVVRRMLAEPLVRLTSLIPRVTDGDLAMEIPYGWRGDEVGQFSRSLAKLLTFAVERRDDDWIKTRLADLAGSLQLADDHEQFGDLLLRALCGQLDAGYGVAYLWDEDRAELRPCAGYGVAKAELAQARFKAGQGPAGQCLVEARVLTLSPVPGEHFRIVSALGSALPDTLSFAPLISRGEPIGVIELATLKPLSQNATRLLNDALGPTALAWQTLARSQKTRELLDVTQTQSEELKASEETLRIQQEQLRSTNEALRSRSQLLEQQGNRLLASEEELRAQAEELRLSNDALREKTTILGNRQTELEAARTELERRAAELERASRYKSEFLANMSHELRTPLNSLLILSKGLADDEDGNLLPDQIESARIVYESGQSLLELINDILDLSKVEAGRMQIVPEDVDIAEFAGLQERNFRHVARSRNLDLLVHVADGLPKTIRTDGARLGQIVVNLLSNAFKFTQTGGVTLSFDRPEAEIVRLPGLSPENALRISIADTGIGIPPERLDAIFKPFEQVDSGTSRRFGGTGLGLSIVSGMIRLLGGDVLVRSTPDQGSTFILIVPEFLDTPAALPEPESPPRAQPLSQSFEAPAAAAAAAPSAASRRSPERLPKLALAGPPVLLIVEDDPTFATILAGLAERRQLPTRVTSSGEMALQIAREVPLLGVLLDIGLPDISGWRVLEQLKAMPATRNVPVHIISAEDDTSRGLAMGAVGFLTKPVTRDAVLQTIQSVVEFGAQVPLADRCVLLVDDDAHSRAAVRKLLEHEAAQIFEASDARSAAKALGERHFDCVVLDLGLPDISGFELLEQLSALGPLPPIVVYSGRDLTDEENLRLRQYTDSIVIKGVRSPQRLLDEVSLFLHALGPAGSPAPPLVQEAQKDVDGRHVLIVDDDMRNIFALSKALRARKLQVTMAQDGYKAIAQLDANPQIDLVLMDIMMPGIDGYETIRRIRERLIWSELPIIAVTAKAMTGDREKCLEAGASDYLTKPIDIDKLMSLIRVWI